MLTSFFGKSAPINYVLVSVYILVFGLAKYYFIEQGAFGLEPGLKLLLGILALIFSMLMVDFIVRKNTMTQGNSYAVLIFASICMTAPDIFSIGKWLAANVFILLALRRIFSLRTNQNLEKKLLDATLWLCLATVNYFWSILLFIPLFQAIQLNNRMGWRYVLVPPVSVGMFIMLYSSFYIIKEGDIDWNLLWRPDFSLDFSAFDQPVYWALAAFLVAQLAWGLFLRFQLISRVARKDRPNLLLTIYILAASILLVGLNPDKTGGGLLFLATPIALLVTSVIEQSPKPWLKEMMLWAWLILPLLQFFA